MCNNKNVFTGYATKNISTACQPTTRTPLRTIWNQSLFAERTIEIKVLLYTDFWHSVLFIKQRQSFQSHLWRDERSKSALHVTHLFRVIVQYIYFLLIVLNCGRHCHRCNPMTYSAIQWTQWKVITLDKSSVNTLLLHVRYWMTLVLFSTWYLGTVPTPPPWRVHAAAMLFCLLFVVYWHYRGFLATPPAKRR